MSVDARWWREKSGGQEELQGDSNSRRKAEAYLVDVFEFVDELTDDRVGSFHLHLRVGVLGFDPIPHHPHSVAGNTGT